MNKRPPYRRLLINFLRKVIFTMKNKQIIVASVMCVALLSGCGTTTNETPAQSATESTPIAESSSTTMNDEESSSEISSEETKVEQTFKIGETVTTQNWEITVNSIEALSEVKDDFMGFKPDEGNKYVVANVTVKNIGKEADSFLPSFGLNDDISAKLMYEDYEFSGTNLIGHSEDMHDAHINPLSSKTGIMAFSVAADVADKIDELSLVFSEGDNKYTVSFAE